MLELKQKRKKNAGEMSVGYLREGNILFHRHAYVAKEIEKIGCLTPLIISIYSHELICGMCSASSLVRFLVCLNLNRKGNEEQGR